MRDTHCLYCRRSLGTCQCHIRSTAILTLFTVAASAVLWFLLRP